jgi:hypothetical protein
MQVEDATAIFQKIDVNENGTIEKEEMLRVLEEDELIRDFLGSCIRGWSGSALNPKTNYSPSIQEIRIRGCALNP